MCSSGKESFATVHDAQRALRNGGQRAKYTYRCECGAWHLTKMARDHKERVDARRRRRAQYGT